MQKKFETVEIKRLLNFYGGGEHNGQFAPKDETLKFAATL